ncbi:MAG: hypothetical protein P0Y50_08835 [Candidatus Brevundimonas colombiensis]|uniref:Uncharacterized protein n=1 Tax=Candidatus Brevundimonas colombiensis TaxID=3121376 RepID=A0AAJ5WZW5_9CAUL|nr:hypothetical protein [Brevundimonas sp.]WEK38657.1 MAG: hypothetical protein P0Y50_08835 [Brevundimonas sp.]
MTRPCRFLVAADAYQTGVDMRRLSPTPAPAMLCVWAHYHPDAVAKLADTPPWLTKAALAADLWRPGQCDRCPCFEAGAAIEQPRTA